MKRNTWTVAEDRAKLSELITKAEMSGPSWEDYISYLRPARDVLRIWRRKDPRTIVSPDWSESE
jgi:hypothetical protein